MPVQVRLIAPFHFKTRRASACAAEPPKLRESGAAPERRAIFSFNKLRSSQVGRRRPHKPLLSGFDSRLRYHFLFGLLDHSEGHLPCKQESAVQSRGGPPFHSKLPWPRRGGIHLLNGSTQVQILPGAPFHFPDDVKVACPPVKRNVVVRVHVGEPSLQNGARPASRGSCPENSCACTRRPGCKSPVLRHFQTAGLHQEERRPFHSTPL